MNTSGLARLFFRQGALLWFAPLAIWATPSCRSPRQGTPSPLSHVDRLVKSYADLEGGRFAVIADFEDLRHRELFRLAAASDEARIVFDHKSGRPQTGRGGLLFTSTSIDDAIVVSNAQAENWYLKRDWRPFDLLLISVRAPRRGLTLEVTVAGSPPRIGEGTTPGRAAGTTTPLQAGWNLVRLDLAGIGERVPLDDVREIRLAVGGTSEPVQVAFDDLLLTASRRVLLGDPTNRAPGLYVEQIGRRWRIGAAPPPNLAGNGEGSDFELTFAQGQIVAWYNLATDPNRLQNLVRGARLGPMPMVIGSADANERDFIPLGPAVVAHSQIVELNPVRVVVACEWRFVRHPGAPTPSLEDRPFQRWLYTIYPSGQIYVQVEATASTAQWSAPELGLAVTVASSPGMHLDTFTAEAQSDGENADALAYATARSDEADAVLLYAVRGVSADRGFMKMRASAAGDSGVPAALKDQAHESLVAPGGGPSGDVYRWACHLFVGSSSKLPEDEAQARALAYLRPRLPEIKSGRPAPASPAIPAPVDSQRSSPIDAADRTTPRRGFDPAQGCFVIAADALGARLVLPADTGPYFAPSFRVSDSAGLDAWVYADQRLVHRVARDARGDLIFQLPGRISATTVVEVLFSGP